MRNKKRKERATAQTAEALSDEMAWIARKRVSSRHADALVMARVIRRIPWSAQARDRLRPAFDALVISVGGVKNNPRFTPGERSHFYAARDALKARGQANGFELAHQTVREETPNHP